MKMFFKVFLYVMAIIGLVFIALMATYLYKEHYSNPLAGRTYACIYVFVPETYKFYGDGTVDMDGTLNLKYSFIKDGQAISVHMPPDEHDPNGVDIIFTMPKGNKLEGKVNGIWPVHCKQVTDKQAAHFLKHMAIGGKQIY